MSVKSTERHFAVKTRKWGLIWWTVDKFKYLSQARKCAAEQYYEWQIVDENDNEIESGKGTKHNK